jgi:hypothetical protein
MSVEMRNGSEGVTEMTKMQRFEEMEVIVRRINAIKRNIATGYCTDDAALTHAQWLLSELRSDLAKLVR